MAGSAIDVFTDFVLSTGPAFLTGPEDIVNDAVKNTYTLPRFIFGKTMREMVQGGNSVKDNIFLGVDSNSANYKPNAEFNYRNPQVLSQWSIPWRFTKDEMVWTDHEIGLNVGEMSQGARIQKFKDIKYSKEMNLYTGLLKFIDDQFWAGPDVAEMEASDGETPYTLNAFITENGSADLPNTAQFGTVPLNGPDATAWTTVMGIAPASKPNWRNAVELYGVVGPLSGDTGSNATTHLFRAMSRGYFRVRFDQVPKYPRISDPASVPSFYATSLWGVGIYESALRQGQDTFVWTGRQDPAFGSPTFRGVEIVYISDLDTAALYAGAAGALATEVTATLNGPRYYGINGQFMLKTIHRDRYFYKKAPFSPSKQPYTHIMIVDMWHNNVCRSRRRHVQVSPSATAFA